MWRRRVQGQTPSCNFARKFVRKKQKRTRGWKLTGFTPGEYTAETGFEPARPKSLHSEYNLITATGPSFLVGRMTRIVSYKGVLKQDYV